MGQISKRAVVVYALPDCARDYYSTVALIKRLKEAFLDREADRLTVVAIQEYLAGKKPPIQLGR